jgi:hypothetical protein
MNNLNQALETEMANIQSKTGRTLGQLVECVKNSGLRQHAEIRAMFHREMGLGHGDANVLTHAILNSDGMRD